MTVYSFAITLFVPHSYSASADFLNVINFARGLGIQSAKPFVWTELHNDCCKATGITCVGPNVTIIAWSSLGLDGTINATAIPKSLLDLNLNTNLLTGIVPASLPNGLTKLDLSRNQLHGTIPVSFPDGLEFYHIQQNQINGSIPSSFPNTLSNIDISHNLLTGSIPSRLPTGLVSFHLHDNKLSGNLPAFPASLNDLWLGWHLEQPGNYFSGTLRLKKPVQIEIYSNWISDIIVDDTSAIDSYWCDLSLNPLLGNPNLARLSICGQRGLYNATSLPITIREISSIKSADRSALTTSSKEMTTSSTDIENNKVFIATSTIFILTATERTNTGDSATIVSQDDFGRDQDPINPALIYGLTGGFVGLCVLVGIAKLIFKHPKMHSKYGRKNSFGTLNTMATAKTVNHA